MRQAYDYWQDQPDRYIRVGCVWLTATRWFVSSAVFICPPLVGGPALLLSERSTLWFRGLAASLLGEMRRPESDRKLCTEELWLPSPCASEPMSHTEAMQTGSLRYERLRRNVQTGPAAFMDLRQTPRLWHGYLGQLLHSPLRSVFRPMVCLVSV